MTTLNLKLDYDALREKSQLWIRRASIFLGIASNTVQIRPEISHVLETHEHFIIVPHKVSDEQKLHFLEEFETWVIGSALRDLIEGHSAFLHAVYTCAELIKAGSMPKGILDQRTANFERNNVIYQRRKVFELFDCEDHFDTMFASMVKARNCYAHRNGVVAASDTNTDGALKITWRFWALIAADKNQNNVRVDLNKGEQYRVEAGQRLKFGPVQEDKTFAVGQSLRLTKHDLNQILFGFHLAAEAVIEALHKLAESHGIKVDASNNLD